MSEITNESTLAQRTVADPNLPEPITRIEQYLAKMNEMDVEVPEPITRIEKYLWKLAKNGGGGGCECKDVGKVFTMEYDFADFYPEEIDLAIGLNYCQVGIGFHGYTKAGKHFALDAVLDGIVSYKADANDSVVFSIMGVNNDYWFGDTGSEHVLAVFASNDPNGNVVHVLVITDEEVEIVERRGEGHGEEGTAWFLTAYNDQFVPMDGTPGQVLSLDSNHHPKWITLPELDSAEGVSF